jgi:hypothetical protein
LCLTYCFALRIGVVVAWLPRSRRARLVVFGAFCSVARLDPRRTGA